MSSLINVRGENRLFRMLAAEPREALLSVAERLLFRTRDRAFEAMQPTERVYFPLTGVLSLVVPGENGSSVEIATVGNEGMMGTHVFLGAESTPLRAFAQVPGESLAIPSREFLEATARYAELNDIMRRYTQGLFMQISQSTLCRHLHPIEQRLCRWLLMTQDRVGSEEFPLTQEFLAQMLGVRRPSVTVVAGMLQKAGLISYHRGVIQVIDRERLEQSSCTCYLNVRKEYERLLA